MKERPVIFGPDSVRAILDGKKTQTRRVIKPQPVYHAETGVWSHEKGVGWDKSRPSGKSALLPYCPYGSHGDKLWCRERFTILDRGTERGGAVRTIVYEATQDEIQPVRADHPIHAMAAPKRYQAMFMPRWASRLTLEICSVRVERVKDIKEIDCEAEIGVEPYSLGNEAYGRFTEHWDNINAKRGYPFSSNPFVWVIEFQRVEEAE